MKLLLTALIALLFCPQYAIAQLDRTASGRISEFGTVAAKNNTEARKLCNARGGNLIIKVERRYYCFYQSR